MKTYNTPVAEPIKVVTDATENACVYCGGDNMFEECSSNPISVNYVGN